MTVETNDSRDTPSLDLRLTSVKTPLPLDLTSVVIHCCYIVDHYHALLHVCTTVAPIIVPATTGKTLRYGVSLYDQY